MDKELKQQIDVFCNLHGDRPDINYQIAFEVIRHVVNRLYQIEMSSFSVENEPYRELTFDDAVTILREILNG